MRKLLFLLVVVAVLYFLAKDDGSKSAAPSPASNSSETYSSEPAETDLPSSTNTSDWGEGHQAGYDWAEQHGIDDEDACDQAGEHSNSPSFADGCKAYVDEQQ
jgi:hypothetical protein